MAVLTVSGSDLLIYLHNKKLDWLFIVDPISLVWHTYISHSSIDPQSKKNYSKMYTIYKISQKCFVVGLVVTSTSLVLFFSVLSPMLTLPTLNKCKSQFEKAQQRKPFSSITTERFQPPHYWCKHKVVWAIHMLSWITRTRHLSILHPPVSWRVRCL